jgi:predicted DNA-binding ribbon-helix-helix protein
VEDPVRLSVDYERRDIEALEEIARERGVSIASLVRKAVSAYLKRRGKR